MPTYVYQYSDDDSDGETFEVFQKMSDEALTAHPESGRPVRRVPMAPNIGGSWSEAGTRNKLSDANLDRLGFTKYQNAGDGKFEKRAGQGPDVLAP